MEHRNFVQEVHRVSEDPKEKKIKINCIQKTRWVGSKARNVNGFKLWYSGSPGSKNGVGILVDGDLREQVIEVRRVNDWLLAIKLVVGRITVKVFSAYALYSSLDEEVKMCFWEELDAFLGDTLITEKVGFQWPQWGNS